MRGFSLMLLRKIYHQRKRASPVVTYSERTTLSMTHRKLATLTALAALAVVALAAAPLMHTKVTHAQQQPQQPAAQDPAAARAAALKSATDGTLGTIGEIHLRNIRQVTFGGQNAEAYFSADDKQLIFQHQGSDVPCDQIYTIPVSTPDGKPAQPKLVS